MIPAHVYWEMASESGESNQAGRPASLMNTVVKRPYFNQNGRQGSTLCVHTMNEIQQSTYMETY